MSDLCKECGACPEAAVNQPTGIEVRMADGVFVKQMAIKDAGIIVPQHAHKYDHLSMLAAGAVRVWIDGALIGDCEAPAPLVIRANAKHSFMSLVPDTVIYCIHNVRRTGAVEVTEENQIVEVK